MAITLLLPSNRRAMLRGFWITLAAVTAVPICVAAFLYGAGLVAVLALLAGGLIGCVPLLHQEVAWRVYRWWNSRLVRPFAAFAVPILLRVSFLVVRAASRGGRPRMSVGADRRESAVWTIRDTFPSQVYSALFAANATPASGRWMHDYVRWAFETRNAWSVTLLPYLWLLRLMPKQAQPDAPANIYTLF